MRNIYIYRTIVEHMDSPAIQSPGNDERMRKLHAMESQLGLSRSSPANYNIHPPVSRGGDDTTNNTPLIHSVNITDIPNNTNDEIGFRRNTFWKSCCCDRIIDKRATQYFTQIGLGLIVMAFSMYKLVNDDSDCRCECKDDTSVYVALISSLLGWFLPSPQFT